MALSLYGLAWLYQCVITEIAQGTDLEKSRMYQAQVTEFIQ